MALESYGPGPNSDQPGSPRDPKSKISWKLAEILIDMLCTKYGVDLWSMGGVISDLPGGGEVNLPPLSATCESLL